ncbi:MAG: hypothetical protein P3W97_002790 [Tepidimonas sp.]|uniref:hypothetical protein n=1 Tax=Tepidimonas sp. TaxID=2002775 RepID=UPI00259DDB03|nr:hypothetical protein [Tepidimonas sp.]MDM7456202.1 hypothetical protein [Tepidimonas sp.]
MPWLPWTGTAAVWASLRNWRAHRREAELPWLVVPRPLLALLAAVLALQGLDGSVWRPAPTAQARPLPPAPRHAALLTLLAAGDAALAQRVGLIWLQSFDTQPGVQLALRQLDSDRLASWLERLHALNPESDYAVSLAALLYLHWGDARRRELLVPWVEARFLEAPDRRWRFLAYPAVLLRRMEGGEQTARRWARLLREHAQHAPSWARQLEAFIAEGLGDRQAAAALIALFLRDGVYHDEAEKKFLEERLQELAQP